MISLSDYKSEVINGQTLYFPTKEDWTQILSMDYLDGAKISPRLVKRLNAIEFPLVSEYSELSLACAIYGAVNFFMFYVILEVNGEKQRIALRKTNCDNCNWEGFFGDPCESESYEGIISKENKDQAYKRIKKIPLTPCPKCGNPLNRTAVWVGELESST